MAVFGLLCCIVSFRFPLQWNKMYSHWLNTNYFKTWENNKKPQDYPGMFLFSLFKYHEYKINLKLHWVIHVSVMNDGKQYFIWYWWEIRLESLLMIWRSIHNFIRLVNKSIRNCFTIQGAYLDNKKYILNTAYVDKEQLYINLKPECKVIWNEIKKFGCHFKIMQRLQMEVFYCY